ncbi:MAG: outer membrane protein transport protein [Steroidobacteraceae bacterium]
MSRRLVLPVLLLASCQAYATNGYYSHGYGVKSKAQGGVGIALSEDALVIASNPAGLVDVADGYQLGVDVFLPSRGSELRQGPSTASFDADGTSRYFIPEIGYSRHIGRRVAVGIAVFGNGGLATDYENNPFARFGAQGSAGVDLSQAFISPAIAVKVSETQSLGLAVNLGYQVFKAKGIGLFSGFSSSPANVSDRGSDTATGWGVRVGWTGHFGDKVTLGATWQSKTEMGRFDKYRGLFADRGGFDAPETYGLGISLRPINKLTLALDWQRILYNDVPTVGNSVASLFTGVPLGAPNGPGFGWQNVSVWKVGGNYVLNEALTLRAGFSLSSQPIPSGETFFNILAPGVVRKHVTLGGTWSLNGKNEFSASYLHAFKENVNGFGSIPAAFGGGEANIHLQEDSFGIAFSHRF